MNTDESTGRRRSLAIYSAIAAFTALSLGLQYSAMMSVALTINTVMWVLSIGVLCADIWADSRRQNTNQEVANEVVPPD
jgi:hypothetical protein